MGIPLKPCLGSGASTSTQQLNTSQRSNCGAFSLSKQIIAVHSFYLINLLHINLPLQIKDSEATSASVAVYNEII